MLGRKRKKVGNGKKLSKMIKRTPLIVKRLRRDHEKGATLIFGKKLSDLKKHTNQKLDLDLDFDRSRRTFLGLDLKKWAWS